MALGGASGADSSGDHCEAWVEIELMEEESSSPVFMDLKISFLFFFSIEFFSWLSPLFLWLWFRSVDEDGQEKGDHNR